MIVIVGGGICGLAIGWRLAQAGAPVTVLERGEAGMEATWAAAGMLAPQIEAEHGEEVLLPLALASRALWPDFAKELKSATGIDTDYRTEGTLLVALDRDDREHLEHRYDYFRTLDLEIEMLSGYQARQREPHLARGVTGALYSPEDHQVDNRKVAIALKAALVSAGGILREGVEVEEIVYSGGRVTGVIAGAGEIDATTVVLAAGAWSRNLPGIPDAARPPVRPLKGQMLAIQMDPGAPLLKHVVWGPGNAIVPAIYLAPKSDGRLIVGATVEEMGFDTGLTAGGMLELLRYAWETLPGIYDLPLVESWAGLRPASRDDAPILGASGVDGLVMATGHHRNGILLAPITATVIADYILEGKLAAIAQPFLLERFKRPGAAIAAEPAPVV